MGSKNHKAQIRRDYFLEKYVIITPKRVKRPRDIREETVVEAKKPCPFCPSNIERKLIVQTIGSQKNWKIVVLKNKYPALTLNNPRAYGDQEVIVETPKHNVDFGDLPLNHLVKILNVYVQRTQALSQKKEIEYVLIFKNYGGKAGASIYHAHSQAFASRLMPPDVIYESTKAQEYQVYRGSCPYCDILKKENRSPRKIFSDKNILAFAPYASAYHYEAWILTRRHIDNITELNQSEKVSIAKALKKIIGKLNDLNLSYNFFLHQLIKNTEQHFYLKIQPRESIWAGVELGSGIVINSISPEEAAGFYRK